MRRRVATQRVVRTVVAALIVAVGIVVAAGYIPGGTTPAFAAQGTQTAGTDHRAVVTVDTGSLVKTVCIHFTADSISGTQALDLAGVYPVYRGYGTTGAAVCSLCNQGCPPDSSCLTCGGANYWQYYRSPAGTASYTYSAAGAGATQVHDGDVEAWKWGNRQMPVYVTVDSVCGPSAQVIPTTLQPQITTTAPAAQTTSATSSGSGSGGSSGGNAGKGSGSSSATTAAKSGAAAGKAAAGTSTALPGASTSTAAGTATTTASSDGTTAGSGKGTSTAARGATKQALSDPVAPKLPGSKGGGSPLPLILVGLLVLALVGAGVFLRLRRGRPASS